MKAIQNEVGTELYRRLNSLRNVCLAFSEFTCNIRLFFFSSLSSSSEFGAINKGRMRKNSLKRNAHPVIVAVYGLFCFMYFVSIKI